MTYSIEHTNEADYLSGPLLSAKILHRGAELYSLKLHHPKKGTLGLLLNDDEVKPNHPWWNSHAPLLFPIVGGLVGKRSKCSDGTEIALDNHGFARNTVFRLKDSGAGARSAWIEYYCDSSMVAGAIYPWRFFFTARYELSDENLSVGLNVENRDTSKMWYQLGWHPGFKTPFIKDNGAKSAMQLLLPDGEYTMFECDRNSFLTGSRERKKLGGAFPFTEEGLDYTYVFDMSELPRRYAALYDPASGITVTVEFDDLPHLGVWSGRDAPFICLEPWQGCDDYAAQTPFDKKFGIVSLAPGKRDTRKISVSIAY